MTDFFFGAASRRRLKTCHPSMQAVATRALELSPVDFGIIHGWRDQETQDMLVRSGASRTPWPQSKHNVKLHDLPWSHAVDYAPVPINGQIPWDDNLIFAVIAGCFFAAAKERGVQIRWGGDWDLDGSTTDQTFMDLGHVELFGVIDG